MTCTFKTMGVMNITPNSFSDGGIHQEFSSLQSKISSLSSKGHFIFDFGAESTAPFNEAISSEVEKQRLTPLFEYLCSNEKLTRSLTLSLDSYHYETVTWFFRGLRDKARVSPQNLIWNDVSGQWDTLVKEYFKEFPLSPYIYSHNLAPQRELTSSHMEYVDEELDIFSHISSYFLEIGEDLRVNKISNPIYLDPCFGFSKTYEQNWDLIHRFSDLTQAVPGANWIVGLSKKSFLRRFLGEQLKRDLPKEEALIKSEWLHYELIKRILNCKICSSHAKEIIFRVHDSDIVDLAKAQ